MSDLSWKVKGQPRPLEPIYSYCLIRLNISSENNDQGFRSFKKINFSKTNPFNCAKMKLKSTRQLHVQRCLLELRNAAFS